ncbi:MAG: tryptophan--tRNA ligase [Candidatus Peregrinibacteria bacterium]
MRILTGIQPSGSLHLGNYFGAVLPALRLAEKYEESVLFLADLHALTTVQDKKFLKDSTTNLAIDLLACGLDPEKTLFFKQSAVPAHTELSWILSCLAPMGLLERAHSFKDKKAKGMEATAGLFTYPILMSADILLYEPDFVPVGKDQKQHLEMARDLAQKFNISFGDTFSLPDPVISEETGIIPGTDGQKMSKSYGNTIPLFGTENEIKKAIMGIKTDSTPVEDPKNPETCTIFQICRFFLVPTELESLRKKYEEGGMGYGEAKNILFEAVKTQLFPLWERKKELEKNPQYIIEVLAKGAEKANLIANRKLEKIKKKVGLL